MHRQSAANAQKTKLKELIDRLLHEIEEEDVGISLFSILYQDKRELDFFKPDDRERVCKMLKKISDDSRRHKEILERIVNRAGEKYHEE